MTFGVHLESLKKSHPLSDMVMVFNTGLMELITKASGNTTRQKDREFFGMLKVIFTTENFKMIWQMAMENIRI